MRRHWIEYTPNWRPGPMTFWVHRASGDGPWSEDAVLSPPKPNPIVGRGFATYFVEYDRFVFQFASLDEMRECIAVLSQKLMPTTRRLSQEVNAGPNTHWLSRLPGHVKPWNYREGATKFLASVLDEIS